VHGGNPRLAMFALGQNQTWRSEIAMSLYPKSGHR
jgi:hypothetical protein